MPISLTLYNTLTKQKEPFESMIKDKASLYCCGPTVYNYAHIGNLRTYIFEDILRRTLEYRGYKVNHVLNITDVGHLSSDGDDGEDKVIQAARSQGLQVEEMAEIFTKAFLKDCHKLNIKSAHHYPRATAYISKMISFIQELESAGFTYEAGGNLYFDTTKDPNYGILRGYREVTDAHTRVGHDELKRSASDFVLWFTRSKFNDHAMLWDSPWGKGYPGWHLECSTMSSDLLGNTFDLHCGGVDHIAIHHTNEIAQNYGYSGTLGAKYWLHGEFLVLDKNQKMSKSSGNFLTLNRLEEEGIPALTYRYFLLQTHYRKPLTFHFDAVKGAGLALQRLRQRCCSLLTSQADYTDLAKEWIERAFQSLYDDLNTAEMIATLWLAMKSEDLLPAEKFAIAIEIDRILAVDLFSESMLNASERVATKEELSLIEEKITLRNQARLDKNFALADAIRAELLEMGVVIKDEATGTQWQWRE